MVALIIKEICDKTIELYDRWHGAVNIKHMSGSPCHLSRFGRVLSAYKKVFCEEMIVYFHR